MTKIRDKEFLLKFGANIRKLRLQKGLSQYELSDMANVNRSQIIKIESGTINTTLSTIKSISEALELDIKELFEF